jgi:hypothetical protein
VRTENKLTSEESGFHISETHRKIRIQAVLDDDDGSKGVSLL